MELTIVSILLIINLIWNLEEFQVTSYQSLLSSCFRLSQEMYTNSPEYLKTKLTRIPLKNNYRAHYRVPETI